MFPARYDLPRIMSHTQASLIERNIIPIRGRSPKCKPLGKRRNTHVTIRKEDETIRCRLYNTDVVTYYPDKTIGIDLGSYATQTTIRFVEELLGAYLRLFDNHAWIVATHEGNSNPNTTGEYMLRTNGENLFRVNEHGRLTYLNPLATKVRKVDRTAANNVRKQYQAFRDYIVRIMRLRDDGFSHQEYGDVFGWADAPFKRPNYPVQLTIRTWWGAQSKGHIAEFLELARSGNNEQFYRASLWLLRGHNTHKSGSENIHSTAEILLKAFNDCMLYGHRDEVFVEEVVPAGVVVKDRNARFFD